MVSPERGEIVTRSKTPRFFSITRIEARFVSATVSKTLRIPMCLASRSVRERIAVA